MATTTATRRLAAILAADVAGYSRLMGADEEGTHERVKAHLVELVDQKIREHHGRIVKTIGDGVLAEFASVVDAVRCAGEIQCAMADRDLDLAEDRRLRFRIGVNLGDVIADGDDIYGDGVNIAARLEGLAAPGAVCISGTVRDHIGDRLPYAFEDMGEQHVKNIARPVRVYALRPEGVAGLPTASASSVSSSSPPLAAPRLRAGFRYGQSTNLINHTTRGDRPDLLDAVGADADIPVVEVDGRVAMAGIRRILSPMLSRLVAAETASRPCSSEARS
jgi:adenylate cyclase